MIVAFKAGVARNAEQAGTDCQDGIKTISDGDDQVETNRDKKALIALDNKQGGTHG
jgi:hypothetical protein